MTPEFFQVFAKNSLIKNILKEEKSLIVEHDLFLEKNPLPDIFWPRPGLQANHGTVQKKAIFPQASNQKQLK